MTQRPRVLVYVQHLHGVGHLSRAIAIAHALAGQGMEVRLINGGRPVDLFLTDGFKVEQLPPICAQDDSYRVLVDDHGAAVTQEFKDRRRAVLLAAYEAFAPDALIIEHFPFGRRKFLFELGPLLEKAKNEALICCSVRDIVEPTNNRTKDAEAVDIANRFFEHIFVHGDPAFADLSETFPMANRITATLTYTGYVHRAQTMKGRAEPAEIVVSCGGGRTGGALFSALIEARPQSKKCADLSWLFLGGPLFDARALTQLQASAVVGIRVESATPIFLARLRSCQLSISRAGYNTAAELAVAGANSLLIPAENNGQKEQLIRARKLAARQCAAVHREGDLGPHSLAAAIDAAFDRPRTVGSPFRTDGAERTASLVKAALAKKCKTRRNRPAGDRVPPH